MSSDLKKATKQVLKSLDNKPCTVCGVDSAKLLCVCSIARYCSKACQTVDWKERGHKKVCSKIKAAREAEAKKRAEAPTPPPSPPRDVFYGPAPRSFADDVRARIAAEHEAARARRERNPEPEALDAWVDDTRCPVCLEDWNVNFKATFFSCCYKRVCSACTRKVHAKSGKCALCRAPACHDDAECVARLRRGVGQQNAMAMAQLAQAFACGHIGLKKSKKKALALLKRGTELGSGIAAFQLARIAGNQADFVAYHILAAQRGNAEAQFHTAAMYIHGRLVPKDEDEAFKWMKLAAEQGHLGANFQLGQMLNDNRGCTGRFEASEAGAIERYVEATRYIEAAGAILKTYEGVDKRDIVGEAT
jgi:hypothetical protein